MNMKEAMAKMRTDEEMTFGELLGPAMSITEPKEANEYLRTMIERAMRLRGQSRQEAESTAKSNLGYFAGYCDVETRKRVNLLFAAVHPVFGNNFEVTAKEAFGMGVKAGEAASDE